MFLDYHLQSNMKLFVYLSLILLDFVILLFVFAFDRFYICHFWLCPFADFQKLCD